MKKTLDATDTPGTVLMISNAGRIVAAVVCVGPGDHAVGVARRPPSSCRSSSTSRTTSYARSRVTPRCLRSSAYGLGEARRATRWSTGSTSRASPMSTPTSRARRVISAGSPSRVRSATPRRSSVSVGPQDALLGALGQHQVAAVGAGPVDQVVLEHQRGDPAGPGDVEPAGQLGGVHVRLEGAERGVHLARVVGAEPALDPAGRRDRVVAVGLSPTSIASPVLSRSMTRTARWSGSSPRVSTSPASVTLPGGVRGARRDQQVGPVARGDHQGAVGQVVQHGRHVCRADHEVEHVPVERGRRRRSARCASSAAATSATVGADDARRPPGWRTPGTGSSGQGRRPPVTRLAITASTVASRSTSEWYAPAHRRRRSPRRPARARRPPAPPRCRTRWPAGR